MENLESLAPTKKLSKGTILLRQGDYCNSGFRVINGCLKSYVIGPTGKEHILQFAPEGWFISDLDSILNSKPTTIFIDAIEDTEVSVVSKDLLVEADRATLLELNHRLFRNIIAMNKRLISLLSDTAEERYLEFTNIYPSLIQRLPLKLISAYIGVTPEYLSEIRRKLARG